MNETAKYKITGLVDRFDEQGVITGQYPIGSVQVLTVEVGTKAVADGNAEAAGEDEVADAPTGATGEADATTGQTGESSTTVDVGLIKKYKVLGEIFPLNEDGSQQENALELDSVQEVPESVGKGWVEAGLAEEVE